MCPRCQQNAPLVYRGVAAYCTACGAPRVPLTGSSVTLAGQPSKVGGTVARVFGWLVLAGGWLVALMIAGLIALLGGDVEALVVGGPIALIASLVAYALLRSGKELKKSGDNEELATKNQAIYALANARGGVLRAWDVAQALHMTPEVADEVLTKLAKESPDHVAVDIDDDGNILYRFPAAHWNRVARGSHPSYGAVPQGPSMAPNAVPAHTRLRVPPPATRVGGAAPPVRVDAREPLEDVDELADAAEPAREKAR